MYVFLSMYVLTCIELKSRIADIEPLKSKNGEELKRAFTAIWNRDPKIINPNIKEIYSDLGTEFKNNIKQDFFKSHGLLIKYSTVNRHSQSAVVEKLNFYIKKILGGIMSVKEEKTRKPNTEWVKHVKKFVSEYNKIVNKKQTDKPIKNWFEDPIIKGKILKEGDMVYVMRDFPTDVDGKRLYGNKPRAGEYKYGREKHKIERICIYSGQEPRYMVSGRPNVSYQKNQLIIASNH